MKKYKSTTSVQLLMLDDTLDWQVRHDLEHVWSQLVREVYHEVFDQFGCLGCAIALRQLFFDVEA